MNTIQQISLKLQLGLDPAADIQPEQLLQKWQVFSEQKYRGRFAARPANMNQANNSASPMAHPAAN